MPAIDPRDLQPGDRGTISVALSIDCTVAEVWDDDDRRYVRVITPARDERIFPVGEIARALVISRGNEIPTKVGR